MGAEQMYAAALALHEQRLRAGWRALGRKIGFTNRSIWPRYGVYEPIWGTVYEQTLIHALEDRALVRLAGLEQPRIEPEICFKLRSAPRSSRIADLVSSIEWMAHSIEIVQCDRPGWKTDLAHSIGANGLHGRLIVGGAIALSKVDHVERQLSAFRLVLRKGEEVVDRGSGELVLGSPLAALAHLVELLARQPQSPQLSAGELVSTGTLTDAHPVAPGELWSTGIEGLPLRGLEVRFA